jgi:hypothetical protein
MMNGFISSIEWREVSVLQLRSRHTGDHRVQSVSLLIVAHLEADQQRLHAEQVGSHRSQQHQGGLTGLRRSYERDQLLLLEALGGLIERRDAQRDSRERVVFVATSLVLRQALLDGLCDIDVTHRSADVIDLRQSSGHQLPNLVGQVTVPQVYSLVQHVFDQVFTVILDEFVNEPTERLLDLKDLELREVPTDHVFRRDGAVLGLKVEDPLVDTLRLCRTERLALDASFRQRLQRPLSDDLAY